ncbi:MAG: rhamnosyltransferase [Geobacteraceae bacterium GWC2_53_11]|nr:MAG: rhamnosyltransferase [Geobacteraceae bacterium GWC2_53_11]
MNVALICPTLNAGKTTDNFFNALKKQSIKPDTLLAIDSSSDDNTLDLFKSNEFLIHQIPRTSFNHGFTRQLALSLCPDADIFIYMTQDAVLTSPHSIKNLLAPFEDKNIGAVCGRQLPHENAMPIAAHARLFNYPANSSIKSKDDIPRIGIKAAFLSNSYSAYRRTALMDVGGFPSNVILSEDTYVGAKMLLAGWKLAYSADATCNHSHNYSMIEEFRRYFDIGVFHGREYWYLELLGKAEGEGKKFVLSELKYLAQNAPWLIPSAIVRTGMKLIGYKLGQCERSMPLWLKRKLSMNKGYWKD